MQRRDFLKISASAGAVNLVTACGSSNNQKVLPVTPGQEEKVTISLCEANCTQSCPFKVVSVDGRIVRIEPEGTTGEDANLDIREFRPCAKGNAAKQKIYCPDRVLNPMKRVGPRGSGQYEEISWEQAFKEIGDKLGQIQSSYGPDSVLRAGCTNFSGAHGVWWLDNLLEAAGGFVTTHSAMSFSQVARAMSHMFGVDPTHRDFSSVIEIQNSDLVLGFGFNPLEVYASGSGMGLEFNTMLNDTPFINFDPRYNDTNLGREEEFHFIRPGTDAALIQGMAYYLIDNDLINESYLREKCYGFFAEESVPDLRDESGATMLPAVSAEDSYRGHILGLKDGTPKTPEWAEKICGVPAQVIKDTADRLAKAKAPYVVAGWGLQRQLTGEDNARSVTTLALMVGAVGNRGNSTGESPDAKGYIFPMAPMDFVAMANRPKIEFHSWPRMIEGGTEMTVIKDNLVLPASRLDENGDGSLNSNLKAIFTRGGSPFNQQADNHKIADLLADTSVVELTVAIDTHLYTNMYLNDYVLPDTTMYERDDIPPTNMQSGSMGFLVATEGLPPIGNVKSTFEICLGIARHMGVESAYSFGCTNDQDALEATYALTYAMRPDLHEYIPATLSEMQEQKIIKWSHPVNDSEESARFHVGYWDYIQHGTTPLGTPTGKIEIFSHEIREFAEKSVVPEYWPNNSGGYINAIPKYMIGPESFMDKNIADEYPLQFVSYHTKAHVHTQYQSEWMKESMGSGAWMNTKDANDLGIKDGDLIIIESKRGKTKVDVRVTRRIMKGVVALGQGRHFDRRSSDIDHGGSANAITSHEYNSPIEKGTGVANCRVKVYKA